MNIDLHEDVVDSGMDEEVGLNDDVIDHSIEIETEISILEPPGVENTAIHLTQQLLKMAVTEARSKSAQFRELIERAHNEPNQHRSRRLNQKPSGFFHRMEF